MKKILLFLLLISTITYSQNQNLRFICLAKTNNQTGMRRSTSLNIFDNSNVNIASFNSYNFTINKNKFDSISCNRNQFNLHLSFNGGATGATSSTPSCSSSDIFTNGSYFLTEKNYSVQPTIDNNFLNYTDGEFLHGYCSADVFLIPLTINNLSVITQGKCDEIKLPSYKYAEELTTIGGSSSNTYNFSWQYKAGNTGTWMPLSETYYDNIIDFNYKFKSEDLAGLSNYTGILNFRFKIVPLNTQSVMLPFYSDIIPFEIKYCAPKIVGQPVVSNLKCYDGANGSVSVIFDRSLQNNEKTRIDLFSTQSGLVNNIYVYPFGFPLPVDGEININLNSNNQFTINNLTRLELPQNYYFNYQSIISGQFTTLETGTTFNITAPLPVIFSNTINENVKCYGGATGKITVTASGGTSNLRYSKDGGSTWQTTNVFTDLASGTYPILVKDINGTTDCIAPAGVQNVTITQPNAALTVTLNATTNPVYPGFNDPISYNSTDGNIDITITGGTPLPGNQYNVSWTKNGLPFTNPANINFEDLVDLSGDGIYTVTVTDANNCSASLTQIINAPDQIAATFTVNQISCFGEKGSIIATVTGGNAGVYTYAWTNSSSGAVIANTATTSSLSNLSAGSYTLTVTDSRGVVVSFPSQTINPAPSVIFIGGATSVDQKCANINTDNIIDITPSGGTGTYTYRWYNTLDLTTVISTSEDLTNVPAGSYTVFVKDNNNCEKDKTFVINPATPIVIISTITNILNPGTSSGSINLNVSGGTGTYSFLWSNGTTSQNLSAVTAGTYSVTITDSNSCVFNSPIYTITSPPAFVVSISQTAFIACNGQSTAALTVNATGGTPPYTFFWTHDGSTTSSISGLSAGIYSVEVRDANNILRTVSFTVAEPSLLDATFAKTNVTCNGANNGTITINPSGGTPLYTYKFTGETIFTSSNSRTSLAPGTYSCEVNDFNNCSKIINNIIITQPAVLSITSSSVTPVSVLGASDGQINITVIGGTSPYTYSWSGTTNTTNNPTGLAAGFYTVTVTDNNGCTKSATYEVTLILPLTATINQTQQISCFGGSNANLVVVPSGGRPPYSYVWSTGATSNTLSNLAVGNYSVTVTDSNTPPSTFATNYTVSQPATAISASITAQTNVFCFGNATGTATVTGSGGTGTYSYSWTNSSNVSVGNATATITGLISGTYYCKVKDAYLCETTKTVVITQPNAALTLNLVSSTNVNIFGQSTGAITINVTGGTSPYTFAWSNGTASQNLSNIPAGTYSVTITDSKGCSTSINSIVITQPNVLNCLVSQTTQNSIQCSGDTTGSLTATTTGGTGAYTYVWKKNGIQVGITNPINNLTAGIYEVTVSDNFTTTVVSYTLNQPTVLSGTFTTVAASCNGGANGSITINPTGGTPPYSYSWFNGSTAQTQNGLSAGNYVVSIKDANNCDSGLLFGTIQPGGGINLNAMVVNGACTSNSLGSISFAPSRSNGTTNGFSISWANPLYTGFTQNNLVPATYVGSITDTVNACVIPFSYTITGATPIVVNLGNDITLCNGQFIEIDGTNIGTGLNYSWTSTNGFASTNPKVTLNLAGTYTLTITTSSNCVYSDSIIITSSGQTIDSKYLVASQTYKNEEIILINVSDKTNTTYTWVFPAAAQIISQSQDAAIVKFPNAGLYDIGLRGVNGVGCVMYDYNQLVIETNTNNVVNTNNNILIKKFNISPNPILITSNLFNLEVELAFELPLTVSIYSISGGALINEITLPPSKIHNKQYDFLTLSSGYYYLVIKTPGSIQGKKIIKQ